MWDIFVLALGAAFYPTLLAIVLVVLTRPRPVRLLAGYLAGGLLAGLGIGFAVVFGLTGAGVSAGSDHTSTGGAIADIAAGVASVALAVALATGHDPRPRRLRERKPVKSDKPSWTKRAISHDSLAVAFALGVVLNLPSVWYLLALKDIVSGGYSPAEQALLIVGFNLIMFAVIEIPLVAYLVRPDSAAATVARLNAWMRSHARQLTEVVAGVVGLYLIAKGVREL